MSPEQMVDTPLDETVYRIYIQPSSFAIDVTCLGTECAERAYYGKYVNDLPDWIQRRLAVLMLMEEEQYGHVIEGVGFRKDRHVFYVSHEANPNATHRLEMLAFAHGMVARNLERLFKASDLEIAEDTFYGE